jgi:ferritin-like metal-binding protein YciE
MRLDSFDDLIRQQLQDLYSAEKQFAAAQPAMAEAASDLDLRDALEQHVEVTLVQLDRLERVAKELGVSHSGGRSVTAKAMLEEGAAIAAIDADPVVRDAALIAAAQRIEHFEIAAYGTLRALAKRVGNDKATRMLEETLAEERGADFMLTEMAEGWINRAAAS